MTYKSQALVKFRQRIPPRWYKIQRGVYCSGTSFIFWHLGALSARKAIKFARQGWRVARMRGVNYIGEYEEQFTAREDHEGVGDYETSPAQDDMQAQLWGNVAYSELEDCQN